jgi:tetratricopeptide (TPR) repeat protein
VGGGVADRRKDIGTPKRVYPVSARIPEVQWGADMMFKTIVCAFLTVNLAATAAGQSGDDPWSQCYSSDPDLSIKGCTAMIQLGGSLDIAGAYKNRGSAYERKGQFELAIKDYTQAIQLGDKDTVLLRRRGDSYFDLGQNDRAIQDFDEAIRKDPTDAFSLRDRGDAYGAKGEYDRALQDLDQAIKILPWEFNTLQDRAYIYYMKGDLDHAIQDYSAAIQNQTAESSVNALAWRGSVYFKKGDYDHALQDYNEATRLAPASAASLFGLGEINFLLTHHAEAVADFKRSVALAPSDLETVLWLHLARRHLGQDDKEELAQQAAKVDSTQWPAPVLKMFLGQMTASQVLGAASDPDAGKEKKQSCDANFFTGEEALMQKQEKAAFSRFQIASTICSTGGALQAVAAAELKLLENTAAPAK